MNDDITWEKIKSHPKFARRENLSKDVFYYLGELEVKYWLEEWDGELCDLFSFCYYGKNIPVFPKNMTELNILVDWIDRNH